MKKVLLYCRVSTEEQALRGQSIDTQKAICSRYAKENEMSIVGVYTDEGKSGTVFNRPALQEMLTEVCSGQADCLIVQDSDRLARDTADYLKIRAILRKNNVMLISINQPGISDSTPEARLIDEIIASINAFQPRVTGRKISETMAEKARQGYWPSYAPYGYTNITNPKPMGKCDVNIISPNTDEAYFVRMAFSLLLETNIMGVVDKLHEAGMQTRTGKRISKSFVYDLLHNPIYAGEFKWGDVYIKDAKHEPLISKDFYYQCHQAVDSRKKRASRKRTHDFLLNGSVYCDSCKNRLLSEKHVKNTREYSYYCCKPCSKYFDSTIIEQAVEELFANIQLSETYIEKILQVAKDMLKNTRNESAVRGSFLLNKQNDIENKMLRTENQLVEGNIDGILFKRIYSRLEDELSNVKREINKTNKDYSENIHKLEDFLKLARDIGTSYKEAKTNELKKQYLDIFFKRILIERNSVTDFELSDDMNLLVQKDSVRLGVKWWTVPESNR